MQSLYSETEAAKTPVEPLQYDGVIHAAKMPASRVQWRIYIVALILSDLVMLTTGFALAYFTRFQYALLIFYHETPPDPNNYLNFVLVFVPVWSLIFSLNGLYQKQNLLGGTREYSRLSQATMYGFLVVIMAGFLQPELIIARGWLLLALLFTFLCTAFGRFFLRRVAYAFRRRGYFLTPAVIIGANQEGRWLAEQLLAWQTSGLRLVGFVDELTLPGDLLFRGVPVLGSVAQLDEIIEKYQIGEVILATSAISSRKKQLDIFKKYGVSDDITVRMSSGLYEIITTGMTVDEFAYVPFVKLNKVRLTGLNEMLKMILDYALTIPGLILISPFLLALAIAVKLDSPGPIIYKRGVLGVNGRRFDAYKFRTMRTDGDKILEQYPELKEELDRNYKLKDDPRITRVGKILRKYSLDELPQLLNVLKREMSLVGPRMITPEETVKYTKWDMNLLTVRPGITGLWQVSGRSDISYDERVQLDMYYVRNWSIWLDLQILFQTIPAVLKSRGAY